jgi:hypothetical protein
LRDVILFGPQLVLHALGQCVRQTLEFAMSGASPQDAQGVNMAFRTWVGPREDRPWAAFASPMNLKVVVWGVGMISLVLNLIALSRLDLLNVLMLLPSLLFSVSALAGPFLMTPLKGRSLGGLEPVLKAAGWLGAFLLYFFISRLLRHHGPPAWLGVAMLATPFLLMAYHALRFAFFRPRLARAKTRLTQMLISLGLHPLRAAQTAGQLMQSNLEDIGAQLDRAALPLAARSIAQTWIETRLRPLLSAPLASLDESRRLNSRWISVFSRSFALAWFVLLWFFLVPVPGLFVVSAGAYRIGTPPETLLLLSATLVGSAMVLVGIGGLWDRFLNRSDGRRGLIPAFDSAFQRFTFMSCRPNHFSDGQLAELHGLFVNMLLYLDQRADAYARDTLCKIQDRLARQPDNQDAPRQ